eukprot:TRINITY_DN9250_c0_g1_i1.p1 TRINITY_DN9250_c0_g1~~TRINITY_DN9250_c0_g1_i1.p1  ORF type:complete len:278 (+),score=59.33 TRINITY_DN9250_c0_g1_i1:134-967(+)
MAYSFFFFKQKTAYEMLRSLVGSEMCIRDRPTQEQHGDDPDVATDTEPHVSSPWWRELIVPVYISSALIGFIKGVEVVCLPLILTRKLDASDAVAGAAIALDGVGAVSAGIPAGMLVAKVGARKTGMLALAVYTVATILCVIAPSLPLFTALRLITGSAFGTFSVVIPVVFAQTVPVNQRGRALSYLGGGNRAAMILGPMAGGLAAEYVSASAALLLVAMAAGIAGGCASTLRDDVGVASSTTSSGNIGSERTPLGILAVHWRFFLSTGVFCLVPRA